MSPIGLQLVALFGKIVLSSRQCPLPCSAKGIEERSSSSSLDSPAPDNWPTMHHSWLWTTDSPTTMELGISVKVIFIPVSVMCYQREPEMQASQRPWGSKAAASSASPLPPWLGLYGRLHSYPMLTQCPAQPTQGLFICIHLKMFSSLQPETQESTSY